jgi:hypothetical protein
MITPHFARIGALNQRPRRQSNAFLFKPAADAIENAIQPAIGSVTGRQDSERAFAIAIFRQNVQIVALRFHAFDDVLASWVISIKRSECWKKAVGFNLTVRQFRSLAWRPTCQNNSHPQNDDKSHSVPIGARRSKTWHSKSAICSSS